MKISIGKGKVTRSVPTAPAPPQPPLAVRRRIVAQKIALVRRSRFRLLQGGRIVEPPEQTGGPQADGPQTEG